MVGQKIGNDFIFDQGDLRKADVTGICKNDKTVITTSVIKNYFNFGMKKNRGRFFIRPNLSFSNRR